jgi:hypothetical protein
MVLGSKIRSTSLDAQGFDYYFAISRSFSALCKIEKLPVAQDPSFAKGREQNKNISEEL